MLGLPVVHAPVPQCRQRRGVRVHTGDDRGAHLVPVGERGLVRADVLHRAVDRVEVHRRLPGRQPLAEVSVYRNCLVGDLANKVAAPVPLVTGPVELVEGAVPHRVGHLGHTVDQRSQRPDLGQVPVRPTPLAGPAPGDAADLLQVQLRRERVRRRNGHRREERAHLSRQGGQELPVPGQDLRGPLDREQGRSGGDDADRVQPEGELGDDAEVAATAAQGPEQVRLATEVRGHERAVRQHHVG